MASPFYDKLLNLVGGYIERTKAATVLERQLPKCNATADSFSPSHLKSILPAVKGALSLYVPDAGKRAEMISKVEAMCG